SSGTGPVLAPPPALAPFRLRGTVFGGRVVLAPVAEEAAEDGEIGPSLAAVYRDVLSGGAGMVLMEAVAVSAEGRISPGSPGLYRDDHVTPWREILAQRDETRAGVVLLHAGRRGATRPRREGVDRPLPAAGSRYGALGVATGIAPRGPLLGLGLGPRRRESRRRCGDRGGVPRRRRRPARRGGGSDRPRRPARIRPRFPRSLQRPHPQ